MNYIQILQSYYLTAALDYNGTTWWSFTAKFLKLVFSSSRWHRVNKRISDQY
jgi:hypothetical protein